MPTRTVLPGPYGSWDPQVDAITTQRLKSDGSGTSQPIAYEVYRNGDYIGRIISHKTPPTIQYRTQLTYWIAYRGTGPDDLVELEGSSPRQVWAIGKLL